MLLSTHLTFYWIQSNWIWLFSKKKQKGFYTDYLAIKNSTSCGFSDFDHDVMYSSSLRLSEEVNALQAVLCSLFIGLFRMKIQRVLIKTDLSIRKSTEIIIMKPICHISFFHAPRLLVYISTI